MVPGFHSQATILQNYARSRSHGLARYLGKHRMLLALGFVGRTATLILLINHFGHFTEKRKSLLSNTTHFQFSNPTFYISFVRKTDVRAFIDQSVVTCEVLHFNFSHCEFKLKWLKPPPPSFQEFSYSF